LGDVFDREIRNLGEFAFCGKHTKGESSRRFVEEFIKDRHNLGGEGRRSEDQGLGFEKIDNSEGDCAKNQEPTPTSPVRPKYPFGTCLDHIYSHSWSNTVGVWLWVRKGEALTAADLGLGYPARREEIRRFGSFSRRVTRVEAKQTDGRSFAEVAAMDAGRGRGPMKRGGMGTRSGDRAGPGRFNEERGPESFEGTIWNRESNFQDLDRDRYQGPPGGQGSGSQGGYREERGRFEYQRPGSNKRQFEGKERLEWEEQELRAKLKRGQEEWKSGESSQWNRQRDDNWDAKGGGRGKIPQVRADMCFNCNLSGHLRKDCMNPPYYYCCKRSGHRSVTCPAKRGLKLYDFGIPGQGFYNFHFPTEKEMKKKEVLGILQVNSGHASPMIIERELHHLYREVPKWTIKQLSEERKYLVTFPDEDIRNQLAKFKSFEFETANVKAKVIPTQMSAAADGKLEVIRIRAHNIPLIARKAETVMEVATLAGDPEEVDVSTLEGEGPIRIRLACRDASQIRGETQVYFNGESHRIRWEVIEEVQERSKSSSKFERHKNREEEEEDKEEGEFQGDSQKGGAGLKDNKETKTGYNFHGDRSNSHQYKNKRLKSDQLMQGLMPEATQTHIFNTQNAKENVKGTEKGNEEREEHSQTENGDQLIPCRDTDDIYNEDGGVLINNET
jgi:hypothetical protein